MVLLYEWCQLRWDAHGESPLADVATQPRLDGGSKSLVRRDDEHRRRPRIFTGRRPPRTVSDLRACHTEIPAAWTNLCTSAIGTAIISQVGQSAGIGFAVPINAIKRILKPLIERGRVIRADLGLKQVLPTDEGILIVDVESRCVELLRLNYPVEAAQAKVVKAGLPEVLAQRLAVGR